MEEDTHVEGAKLAILQRQTANHASPGQTAICSPLSCTAGLTQPALDWAALRGTATT